MLPKDSIAKIIEYYSSNHRFDLDIQRAFLEFFDLDETGDISAIEWDGMIEGLFNEWLVYDFRLANNKTILEDFCENNPYGLSYDKMDLYHRLRSTQKYGLFEVKEIRLDQGLMLQDLYTGETFNVKERAATHTLKPGFLLYNRIACLDDHWELVGANGPYLPIKLTERLRKVFRNGPKEKLTPKEAYLWLNNRKQKDIDEFMVDPAKARSRLQNLLTSTGLQKFININTVINWCQQKGEFNKAFEISSLIFGLAEGLLSPESLDELLQTVQDVYNSTPQEQLGGKSPQEKSVEDPDRIPEFVSDIRIMGGEKWLKKLNQAHNYMQKQDFNRAARAFSEMFRALLKEKTTRADIYRLYANKAVTHFAIGEMDLGNKMVDLAIELNPSYDFAQKLKNKYAINDADQPAPLSCLQTTETEKKISKTADFRDLLRASQTTIKNDPAVKYYEYLKRLGINFATAEQTISKLTTLDPVKVGHKDLRSCCPGKNVAEDKINHSKS